MAGILCFCNIEGQIGRCAGSLYPEQTTVGTVAIAAGNLLALSIQFSNLIGGASRFRAFVQYAVCALCNLLVPG